MKRWMTEGLVLVIAGVVAFPLFWMVLSAFKPADEIISADPVPWTTRPTLASFTRALTVANFGRYFLNSVVVALIVVVLSILISFLAATALTRFRFRSRTTLLIMLLVVQMVPVEALTVPLFFLMRSVGDSVPAFGLRLSMGMQFPIGTHFVMGFSPVSFMLLAAPDVDTVFAYDPSFWVGAAFF